MFAVRVNPFIWYIHLDYVRNISGKIIGILDLKSILISAIYLLNKSGNMLIYSQRFLLFIEG